MPLERPAGRQRLFNNYLCALICISWFAENNKHLKSQDIMALLS